MLQRDLTERMLRLRGVPVLATLPSGEVAQLAASLKYRHFPRGATIMREDEPPRGFFMLITGTVTMRRKDKRIGTVRAPGGVGFLGLLARNAGGTSAIADTPVDAYEFTAEVMDDIFEDNFSVLLESLRFVAERLVAENMASRVPAPFVPPVSQLDHLIGEKELGIVEKIFLLRRMRLFSTANVNSLAGLVQRLKEVRVPAGEVVWKPGDVSDGPLFIVKGMGRLVWNDDETVQQVGSGYAIGGGESLVGHPRWNTFVTDEPSIFLRGDQAALLDMMEDDFELGIRFLSMMAGLLLSIWDRKAEQGIVSVGGAPASDVVLPPSPSSTAAVTRTAVR